MNEKVNTINPAPAAVQLSAEEQMKYADTPTREVPTVAETLEHLENTLDNLDPVDTRSDADKAADEAAARMVAEGGPAVPSGTDAPVTFKGAEVVLDKADVEAIETPAPDDTGSLAEIGRE